VRESAFDKGRRLLVEGRLVVRSAGSGGIRALCRGDSGEFYRLATDNGSWRCSCPAVGRCSHLVALQLVTVPPGATATFQGEEGRP
jgi:uncharacterized Zn finger protein